MTETRLVPTATVPRSGSHAVWPAVRSAVVQELAPKGIVTEDVSASERTGGRKNPPMERLIAIGSPGGDRIIRPSYFLIDAEPASRFRHLRGRAIHVFRMFCNTISMLCRNEQRSSQDCQGVPSHDL